MKKKKMFSISYMAKTIIILILLVINCSQKKLQKKTKMESRSIRYYYLIHDDDTMKPRVLLVPRPAEIDQKLPSNMP